ncbi:MAG: glycosyltransferase [Pseudomonadota bacterium]
MCLEFCCPVRGKGECPMTDLVRSTNFAGVEDALLQEYHELFAQHGIPLWFAQTRDEGDVLPPCIDRPGCAERILMVSTHGHWGNPPPAGVPDTGSQTYYVLEVSKAWGRKGVKVIILARWFEPCPRVEQIGENCWLVRLRVGPAQFVRKEDIYPLAPAMAECATAAGMLFGTQAVIGHYADGMVVAAEVAERLEIPLLCVPHSLGVLKMIRLGMDPRDQQELRDPQFHFWTRETFELAALRAANFEIASTPEEPRALEEYYGIRFPYEVMPSGASEAFFSAGEREPDRSELARYGLDEGRFLIFWGRLSRARHVEGIVQALGEARRGDPQAAAGLRAVIVGGSPTDPSVEEVEVQGAVRAEVEKYGLEAQDVVLVKNLDHGRLAALARGALAYVGTQRLEPFGMSAAEAMAAGIPVILSRRAGIASWLRDGEHAFLVDPKAPAEIAGKVLALIRDPAMRDRVARAGRAAALRHFRWEGIADRLGNLVNRVTGGVDPRVGEVERPAETEHFARRKGRAYHRMTPRWRGDFPHIVEPMVRAAEDLLPEVILRIEDAARHMERLVVAIAGESGSGKTEIAHLLNLMIRSRERWGVVVPGDAFFVRSPAENYSNRLDADGEGRLHEVVGPHEVDLARLDRILAEARLKDTAHIHVPSYSRTKLVPDRYYIEVPVSLFRVDVIFVDLTYSMLLDNATCKIFLKPSARDDIERIRKRNLARDPTQDFGLVERVLEIEHGIIAPLEERADLVVGKDYRLRMGPGPQAGGGGD